MSGRLMPVATLIEAARTRASDLGPLLAESFPALNTPAAELARSTREFSGETLPAGLGAGGVAVWHDTALFAVCSARPPALRIDDGAPLPMTAVPGTSFWFRLAAVEPGSLHTFRYVVGDEPGPGSDVAGYTALSYELPDVRPGTISDRRTVRSQIYPGATTEYWLYANHGIDESRGAPVMIWHDGSLWLEPADLFGLRMQIVTDNLVHLGRIPPMVHVLVSPSTGGEERNLADLPAAASGPLRGMRVLQYSVYSDRYGRHLLDELLPDANRTVKLRQDGYSRGSFGASAGGVCAFTLGWFFPERFSRVHAVIPGTPFDGTQLSSTVRTEERRNIRVWISQGSNDLDLGSDAVPFLFRRGGLPLNTIMWANGLKARGYDFHLRFGEGHHTFAQAGLDLPESLTWLWRDYDPDRTGQRFEQEPAERNKPLFRVRIANRDAR